MNAVVACAIGTTFLVFYGLLMTLQPVALKVSKRQGFPPFSTTAEIRIPRHTENRQACVTLSGPLEDRSCWDLSVDSAPVFTRKWSHLWGGRYFAQARLLRGRDTLFSNTVEITVAEDP